MSRRKTYCHFIFPLNWAQTSELLNQAVVLLSHTWVWGFTGAGLSDVFVLLLLVYFGLCCVHISRNDLNTSKAHKPLQDLFRRRSVLRLLLPWDHQLVSVFFIGNTFSCQQRATYQIHNKHFMYIMKAFPNQVSSYTHKKQNKKNETAKWRFISHNYEW